MAGGVGLASRSTPPWGGPSEPACLGPGPGAPFGPEALGVSGTLLGVGLGPPAHQLTVALASALAVAGGVGLASRSTPPWGGPSEPAYSPSRVPSSAGRLGTG